MLYLDRGFEIFRQFTSDLIDQPVLNGGGLYEKPHQYNQGD